MRHKIDFRIGLSVVLLFCLTTAIAQKPIPVQLPPPKPAGADKPAEGPVPGDKMIDIKFKNEDGTISGLSGLNGKLVLLVFWNSECDHCVVENDVYRDIWLNYKDKTFQNGKGFEIFSISFDKDKALLKKSIEDHNFSWKNHYHFLSTSTMKELYSYKVTNLPGTFLIDGKGTIVDKDFHGARLEEVLKNYLAQ